MSKARTRKSRSESKEDTRKKLLRVARQVFTRFGYTETGVGEICSVARVTHGALYHHFAGKAEIFAAVVTELFTELAEKIQVAADSETGWRQVEAASRAYLEGCMDPAVQVILLREAPAVLAHEDFEKADASVNEPLVAGLMQRWIRLGIMRPLPLPEAARILGGAFAEAGTVIAQAKDQQTARTAVEITLTRLLGGFRA